MAAYVGRQMNETWSVPWQATELVGSLDQYLMNIL